VSPDKPRIFNLRKMTIQSRIK